LHTRINNAALIALCAKSELDRAFRTYKSMRTRSISTEPATFHLLVESFSKTNNTEKAALVVLDMLSERCIPERQTWDVVISGYWSKKKVRQEAEQTWNQLAMS
jgi:pentatricopeptide repeat protein